MLEKILLAPYYLTLKLRHAMYDRGIRKVSTCEVPTICVGNIAAGGTGKTPHTEMILRTLLSSDDWAYKNIAVLSRGHKRTTGGFQQVTRNGRAAKFGDEPLQIKKHFPAVTVAVDRTRVEGCDFLCHPDKLQTAKRARKCGDKCIPPADLIVLDDAFQYRSLRAHFNIVLVDFSRPVHQDRLLPFGRLRDLPERLHYADIIIVTKCPNYLEDEQRTQWAEALGLKGYSTDSCRGTDKKGREQTLLFTSINYRPVKPIYENGDPRYAYAKKIILFSGIAKDTPLRMYLSDTYKIVRHYNFPDHHKYNRWDIAKISRASREFPTAVIATTEKDSQRLLDVKNVPVSLQERLFQVPIEVCFLSDHEKDVFESTLMTALRNFKA